MPAVSQPGFEAARERARGAEARGLYPRLQRAGRARPGIDELTIELKYHEGQPVIREISRVSQARPSRLFEDHGPAAGLQRSRHLDPVDAARRHVGQRGPRRQCRRRSPLPRVLEEPTMSRVGKNPVPVPAGVTVAGHRRQTSRRRASWASSPAALSDEVEAKLEDGKVVVKPVSDVEAGAHDVGHHPQPGAQHGAGRHPGLHARRWRSTASAIAPRSRART